MIWQFGIPTASEYDSDGFLGIQVDVFGDGSAPEGCPFGELQTPYGFQSRPLDPTKDAEGSIDPTASGQILYCWEGSKLHVIPTQDARVVKDLPALKKGESMQYGPANNFVRCHEDGGVTMFCTTDGTADGTSVYAQTHPTGFKRVAPWGMERFDAMGFHVVTKSGAQLRMGGIGGIPGLDAIGSYARLEAATVAISGSAVSLGDQSGTQEPVALATALKAALVALGTALDAWTPVANDGGTALKTALTSAKVPTLLSALSDSLEAKSVTAS